MNENIKFLEKCLEGKTLEGKIKYLDLMERKQYHYFCDCNSNFNQSQFDEYNETWNWILEKLREFKTMK